MSFLAQSLILPDMNSLLIEDVGDSESVIDGLFFCLFLQSTRVANQSYLIQDFNGHEMYKGIKLYCDALS